MSRRKVDPRKFSKALGLRIRALRNERGWTLEECESHGYGHWTHLQKVEAGKNITVETLVKIANMFGISPASLLDV